MFCTKCGEQIPDDGKFCPKCGTSVVEDEIPVTPPSGKEKKPSDVKHPPSLSENLIFRHKFIPFPSSVTLKTE